MTPVPCCSSCLPVCMLGPSRDASHIADLHTISPCQASFNKLTSLPGSLAALPQLELCRVACCDIGSLPPGLAAAPALAWLSLGGNPICAPPPPHRLVRATVHLRLQCLAAQHSRRMVIATSRQCTMVATGNMYGSCRCGFSAIPLLVETSTSAISLFAGRKLQM